MKKIITLVTAVTIAATGASIAFAAKGGPFKKEVKARQGLMQVYAFNLGVLGAMAKGKRDYDAKAAATAAKNLNLAAMMSNGAMWQKGSDLTNKALMVKTSAKPEIWTTWPKISEKQKAFGEAAAKMADAAGGGLAGLKGAIGAVGKSCKGCHDDFRQKKN